MGFDADDEILQDFLVEAGEILEALGEQLVELERNPDDKELLNAIFRGFHTVKGGAGFLQLDALVECCHVAENVFDHLRNGLLSVNSEVMDVVLQALDAVNEMFDQVKRGESPRPADPALIHGLAALLEGGPSEEERAAELEHAESPEEVAPAASAKKGAPGDEISDEEYESLLDALDSEQSSQHASAAAEPASVSASSGSDEITDDEFENLLDQLHGAGKFSADKAASAAKPDKKADKKAPAAAKDDKPAAKAGSGNDEITDDEFEALLDNLHGKGKFKAAAVAKPEAAKPEEAKAPATANSDLITDDEFEKLLDELHGTGKSASGPKVASAAAAKAPVAKAPVAKATPAKAAVEKPQAAPAPKPTVVAKPVSADSDDDGDGFKSSAGASKPGSKDSGGIATETTVRVDTKRLDDIMNMVGELVLVRNRLKRLGEELAHESMTKAVSNLDVVTSDLQSAVMQTRMQPIKKVFGRFPRVVRDLARQLKKEINLELKGEETDLDKNLVEALSDPLVHLVRNAVDHGIERPEVREAAGKPRIGRVLLSAQQEGDHILLFIEDDGGGMDPHVLRRKAVEKGLYEEDAAERLSDTEAFNLIFAPGFSTKTEISDVSGRGVGMDVVKTKITQLNGTLQVESELGKGSRIIIKVPLTLAIMPTLMVMLDQQAFAFPLVSVVEIFHLDLTKTNIVDGQECVVVREKVFPLFHIKRWLVPSSYGQPPARSGHVVIVAVGTRRVGLVVDQLVGQEEVVIKPLGKMLHGTAGMAGATITGDGRIALILDIPSLLGRYSKQSKSYIRPKFAAIEADEPDDTLDGVLKASAG
ncbi:chemotaxis protein CheA [Allohahella sp. A8]|uniref:chemotaxis protein CheA n=1 Tax=Allohahella sp. A8 TaxID=3141461 RepID=UPI003A807AFE